MTIKTKYDIGQVVWLQSINGAKCVEIIYFEIDHISGTMYYCKQGDVEGWFSENELFPTKEELIKSL